jgi:hypothetical protein
MADVLVGAGADAAEKALLRGAPGEHHRQPVAQILLGQGVALDLGKLMRAAERVAARDDRHLVERVGVGQVVGDRGVAGLVHGEAVPLVLVDRHRAQRAIMMRSRISSKWAR